MLGIAVACAAAVLNGLELVAAGYAGVARQALESSGPPAVAAANIATTLTPWSATRHALEGWLQAESGESETALRSYDRALRWAPADALIWTEFAQVRARAGRFDDALLRAVARAQALAPHSPPVQRALAEMGLAYWPHGAGPLQERWLASMRYQLERSPASLLARVLTRGQAQAFCEGPATALGQQSWCSTLRATRADGCYDVTQSGPVPCQTTR